MLLALLPSVLILTTTDAAFAQTATVSCGDTITKSTTLTSDIGPCPDGVNGIIIGADNIILDCRGHSISGEAQTGDGIQISGHSGVTIINCKASGFENGFHLDGSSHNTLKTNTASNNGQNGFELLSSANTLTGNTASNNGFAGFNLGSYSNYNILKLNTASNNVFTGFFLGGDSNTLTTNTAVSNNVNGFFLGGDSNTLSGNTAAKNGQFGFELSDSEYNTLSGNTARSNGGDGFLLQGGKPSATSNTLSVNRADSNLGFGYQDGTTQGTGTAGTRNTYRFNECSGNTVGGSSPTGLCLPQH